MLSRVSYWKAKAFCVAVCRVKIWTLHLGGTRSTPGWWRIEDELYEVSSHTPTGIIL